LDWGGGTKWRATTMGLRGLPEENQDKQFATILQIGRKIIYMVQWYRQLYELERRKNKSLKYLLSKYKSTIIDG
jgi:hypothetical protein